MVLIDILHCTFRFSNLTMLIFSIFIAIYHYIFFLVDFFLVVFIVLSSSSSFFANDCIFFRIFSSSFMKLRVFIIMSLLLYNKGFKYVLNFLTASGFV